MGYSINALVASVEYLLFSSFISKGLEESNSKRSKGDSLKSKVIFLLLLTSITIRYKAKQDISATNITAI